MSNSMISNKSVKIQNRMRISSIILILKDLFDYWILIKYYGFYICIFSIIQLNMFVATFIELFVIYLISFSDLQVFASYPTKEYLAFTYILR